MWATKGEQLVYDWPLWRQGNSLPVSCKDFFIASWFRDWSYIIHYEVRHYKELKSSPTLKMKL